MTELTTSSPKRRKSKQLSIDHSPYGSRKNSDDLTTSSMNVMPQTSETSNDNNNNNSNKISTAYDEAIYTIKNPAIQLFLLIAWGIVLTDFFAFGVGGESNSRGLSFLDSLGHAMSWVTMQGANVGMKSRIVGATLTKYGSGTFVSILLGVTPTVLQGWKSNIGFILALLIAQRVELISKSYRREPQVRTMLIACGALHKSRKLWFAMNQTRRSGIMFSLLIAILTVELTSWLAIIARKILRGYPDWDLVMKSFLQMRFFLTIIAAVACYLNYHPFLIFVLLAWHKSLSPFTFHH